MLQPEKDTQTNSSTTPEHSSSRLNEALLFNPNSENPEDYMQRLLNRFNATEQQAFLRAFWLLAKALYSTPLVVMSMLMDRKPLPNLLADYYPPELNQSLQNLTNEMLTDIKIKMNRRYSSEIVNAINLAIHALNQARADRVKQQSAEYKYVLGFPDDQPERYPTLFRIGHAINRILIGCSRHVVGKEITKQFLERYLDYLVANQTIYQPFTAALDGLNYILKHVQQPFDPFEMHKTVVKVSQSMDDLSLPFGLENQIYKASEEAMGTS